MGSGSAGNVAIRVGLGYGWWSLSAAGVTVNVMSKPNSSRLRRPVGVASTMGNPHVVCDDGAVFQLWGKKWVEVSPIPGTQRAAEVDHKEPKLLKPHGEKTLPRPAAGGRHEAAGPRDHGAHLRGADDEEG